MNHSQLISQFHQITDKKNIITDPAKTLYYRSGYRFGTGNAIAVVKPTTLVEYWKILKACVEADVIVISQAANTGLTGGSTPDGNDYDRDIVIINTMYLKGIQPINQAQQVVCLAGATLNELEGLLKPLHREPHSVIGSSCIGASVIGGICNNSGGALVQRGPAYTEMSIFAQINDKGELELKNHLGIQLGNTPEEILENLEKHQYQESDVIQNCGNGSDHQYCQRVREVDLDTPARFNADPTLHHESAGCAGKLAVFAVRLDTFPLEEKTAVFYIGTNHIETLNDVRRKMLKDFKQLPISGEYIHRDAFDVATVYGKDTFWVIKRFGTAYLPKLFALKAKADRIAKKFPFLPSHLSDKIMQLVSKFIPQQLPAKMLQYRDDYEHHLIVKMGGEGVEEARHYLSHYFTDPDKGAYFECTPEEAQAAMLHRFAVASAAIRYRAINEAEVEDIVALDIALRRNDPEWFEKLPKEIEEQLVHKLYYGHFMCHVFHQDYIVKKGANCHQLEEDMLALLDKRGAQYPAEHNVGHLYEAKPELKGFYKELDPTNSFNPGIGKTSKNKYWK